MKIIATVNSRNFIAELSISEIDYLAGKKIGEEKVYYGNERSVTTGTTFNIVKAFDQIHRNDERKKQVEYLRATLNAMLVGLDMIEPLIEEPKVEEKEPEAQS